MFFNLIRFLLFFLVVNLSYGANLTPNSSTNLPVNLSSPGGVRIMLLSDNLNDKISANFYGKTVTIVKNNNKQYALIGLPLKIKIGSHFINVYINNKKRVKKWFKVVYKKYKTQYITIKNKKFVNPGKMDYKKITEDSKAIAVAKKHYDKDVVPNIPFSIPVKGIKTGSFGLRRFFNKQPRSPHGGMDIAAPAGTPIKAPSAGKIIEVGNYFFSGNCVFINHGQGLVSFYAHMSKIDVKVGDVVKQGDIIGQVGKTGRVTGAHLHWSIGLNGTWVDPQLFLKTGD